MAKTATDVFNDNQIAKGYNNYSGLTNIELITVGGKVATVYLPRVNDLGFVNANRRVMGDGLTNKDGFTRTRWQSPYLSYSQRRYLKTTILGGKESGEVTIKTRLDDVPLDDTMPERYVITNAILTLPPLPDEDKYHYGISPFFYDFTRIDLNKLLHEDEMKGTLYVTGASTAQTGVTTSAEKLTAFTTSGLNAGITTSASDDSHTIIVAEDYVMEAIIDFTATASTVWTFQFYVDGSAVGIKFLGTTNATPDAVQVVMSFPLARDATDVVTIYVNSDDGGGGKDLTVVEAVFTVRSD